MTSNRTTKAIKVKERVTKMATQITNNGTNPHLVIQKSPITVGGPRLTNDLPFLGKSKLQFLVLPL